jgi:asparaginyl-tRNA synthetase
VIRSAARIADILAGRYTGAHVIVRGWVRTRRDSKGGFSFIELNDGSCMRSLQIVAPAELPNYADEVVTLHAGASIEAHGSVVESPGAKQPFELQAEEVRLIGGVDPARYPLHKQRLSFEHLRGVAHLRPRTNTFGAVTRVRNAAAMAIHRFFQSRGFLWIATPIITGSDCEGAGEQFQVTTFDLGDVPRGENGAVDYTHDFFGRKAYLTVSGQLEVENFACALGNVYTFGPTFRAENSNTTRHLSEFWMVEPEMAFADLEDDMALAEAFVKEVIAATLEQCAEDIGFFGQRIQNGLREGLEAVAEAEFTRLPYSEAIEVLQGAGIDWEYPVAWGSDLQAEHEHFLTEQHCGGPVIVYDWPAAIKPFYMRVNDDGRTVGAMDVLVPRFGEIIGGSQREERLDVLERRMEQRGMECETYWWYCDLRRYGTVPHAGFGLGFERLLQFMTGMANIRDVIPFARTPKSADF